MKCIIFGFSKYCYDSIRMVRKWGIPKKVEKSFIKKLRMDVLNMFLELLSND